MVANCDVDVLFTPGSQREEEKIIPYYGVKKPIIEHQEIAHSSCEGSEVCPLGAIPLSTKQSWSPNLPQAVSMT